MSFNFTLTKETDRALCLIYKSYLDKRESGLPRTRAKDFSMPQHRESLYSSMPKADFDDCLRELKAVGLVRLYMHGGFFVEDRALLYMENRFPRGIDQIASVLSAVKGIIPGS